MSSKLAVQLYSVRDELSRDYVGTIEKIAGFGYRAVEFAGCPSGISLEQCAKIIRGFGLAVPSMHVPVPASPNRNMIFDNVHLFGCDYLVTGKGPDGFETVDAVRKSCDEFNFAAAEARKNGLKLAIHNHWWEFQELDGTPVYKTMLEHLSPEVLFELDAYWVKVGGQNPAAVLDELAERIPLVHIKDGSGEPGDLKMTAVGQGAMDFDPVFANAGKAEWLIVELDDCATDMLQAVKESRDYLMRNAAKILQNEQ